MHGSTALEVLVLPDELRVTRQGSLAVLTFHRADKRNAFHAPMWEGLRAVAGALGAPAPRVVILRGEGEHFSAGMDLSMDNTLFHRVGQAIQTQDAQIARELIVEMKGHVQAIRDLPCPVIASIEGACAGGGLEVALAADLRVASETAFFSLPELRVGLAPDVGGTVRLSRLIGHARAADLILTGRRIDAATALAWGLVNRVVPAGEALAQSTTLAQEIMGSAPTSLGAVLPVLRAVAGATDDDAFAAETEAGVVAILGGESLEGASSFLQRRAPSWQEEMP